MKIDNSLDWDVNRSVSANVGRGNNGGVCIDIDFKVGSGDVEGVESEYVDEVGSGYSISTDNSFKGDKKVLSEVFIMGLVEALMMK